MHQDLNIQSDEICSSCCQDKRGNTTQSLEITPAGEKIPNRTKQERFHLGTVISGKALETRKEIVEEELFPINCLNEILPWSFVFLFSCITTLRQCRFLFRSCRAMATREGLKKSTPENQTYSNLLLWVFFLVFV